MSFLLNIMDETFHAKIFMLPPEGMDPQTRDRFCMWFKSIPSKDDIKKLICTEKSMKIHFEKLLKEEKGEVA